MNDRLQKLTHDLKSVHLTAEEKRAGRERLLEFMAVRNDETARHSEKLPFLGAILTFLTPRPMPVFAALLVIFLSGGGVSYAANASLPGELLYPVKISVNEEVRSLLTFSEEAKLAFEIQRAEQRLEEAEELERSGELQDDRAKLLSDYIARHNTRIFALESEMATQGRENEATELRARYEARLSLYEALLFDLLAQSRPVAIAAPFTSTPEAAPESFEMTFGATVTTTVTPEARTLPTTLVSVQLAAPVREVTVYLPLSEVIRQYNSTDVDVRAQINAKLATEAKRMAGEASYELNEMNAALNALRKGVVAPSLVKQLTLKAADAQALYDNAMRLYEAGEYEAALKSFKQSLAAAAKLHAEINKATYTAPGQLDGDTRYEGSPERSEDDMWSAKIKQSSREVLVILDSLDRSIEALSVYPGVDWNLVERVRGTRSTARAYHEKGLGAYNVQDFKVALEFIEQARYLAHKALGQAEEWLQATKEKETAKDVLAQEVNEAASRGQQALNAVNDLLATAGASVAGANEFLQELQWANDVFAKGSRFYELYDYTNALEAYNTVADAANKLRSRVKSAITEAQAMDESAAKRDEAKSLSIETLRTINEMLVALKSVQTGGFEVSLTKSLSREAQWPQDMYAKGMYFYEIQDYASALDAFQNSLQVATKLLSSINGYLDGGIQFFGPNAPSL